MIKIDDLMVYLAHNFNEDNDITAYKVFEEKYLGYIEQLASTNNWEIKNVFKNDYHFSICIKSNKAILTIAIFDVRKDGTSWYDRVYVKLLTDKRENCKNTNFKYYIALPKLEMAINSITNNKINRSDIEIDDIF